MSIWAIFAILKKRADLADIAWGLGFFLVSWISFLFSTKSLTNFIVNLLVTAWAFRLSIHIYLRNRSRKEDFRYQNLKNGSGNKLASYIFFKVFLLQGLILYVVSLPIIWINIQIEPLTFNALWLPLAIWCAGFIVETVADYELVCFKRCSDNRGELLKSGLWGYVRHPNYLGEIVQWWAIWAMGLSLPFGWVFIISPLLITFLIVKISGIAPLEEKMKKHPDFAQYAQTTPSLVPFPLINGALYTLSWFTIVFLGAKGSSLIALITFILAYSLQIYLFSKLDLKSLFLIFPLTLYTLALAFIQETLFIHFEILQYPGQGAFPPLWLLSLYLLFSLTLNSSLLVLNRNLALSFLVGGVGALFSYFCGERMGAVELNSERLYILFLSWGLFLSILILLNRKLMALREKYTDQAKLSEGITVIFDPKCPICANEVCTLKKRRQTGGVIYALPQTDWELKQITSQFSYKEAMAKIHAIDSNGAVLIGIDVLSALYARTNLPVIAILLQAPGLKSLSVFAYAIWAKLRILKRSRYQ